VKSVSEVCDHAGMAMTAISTSGMKAFGESSEGTVVLQSGSDFRWRVRAHKAEFPQETQSPKYRNWLWEPCWLGAPGKHPESRQLDQSFPWLQSYRYSQGNIRNCTSGRAQH